MSHPTDHPSAPLCLFYQICKGIKGWFCANSLQPTFWVDIQKIVKLFRPVQYLGFFPHNNFKFKHSARMNMLLPIRTQKKCWLSWKHHIFQESGKKHLSCQSSIYFTSVVWNPQCYRSFPDRSQGPPTVPSGGRGFSNFIGKDHLGVRETSLRINSYEL